MAIRFDTQYQCKRNDNLGDPDWHNRRWRDIDRRMHARELDATKIDDAVDDLEAAALARLNDQLTPIIAQAITRLRDFGLLFSATSHTERTIQTGHVEFLVDAAMRESFVATGFLILRPMDNLALGMSARTLSYDNITGVLALDCYSALGSGTFDYWSIGVTGDPDLAHATRTDNPHETTAEQVGAYTTEQVDTALASEVTARNAAIVTAINDLIGGAPGALNTLNELAAALGDDENFAATVVAALANRVRFDAAQTIGLSQKQTVAANIGGTAAGELLVLDSNARIPAVDATVISGYRFEPQGRLTPMSDGSPWRVGNVLQNAIRYVPFAGGYVPIYDPSYGSFRARKFVTSTTDNLGLLLQLLGNAVWPNGSIFDLWAADVGGAVKLGTGPAWANAGVTTSARAASGALAKRDGLDVNNADMVFRYSTTQTATIPATQATWLGTYYPAPNNGVVYCQQALGDASGYAYYGLWNRYHRKRQLVSRSDPNGSWAYAGGLRESGSAVNRIFWVDGGGNSDFSADFFQYIAAAASGAGRIGIGHNQVGAMESNYGYLWPGLSFVYGATLRIKQTTLGVNFVAALEVSDNPTTFYGSLGPNMVFTAEFEA